MARVLIIDDDETMSGMLGDLVKQLDHDVERASTLESGLRKAFSQPIDVIFLDVWLPDGNGLEVLPQLREAPSAPEVIIITAEGDANGVEMAIRNGAWDYIEKPSSLARMTLPLSRALQYRKAKLEEKPPVILKLDGIVGKSSRLRACIDLLAKAAGSSANVLLTGETGTGKDLFAWAIHQNSDRVQSSFVAVDCASLPATLVESVLFGHTKGAFTGADRPQEGLIGQAHGGTLFLDEAGEMPLSTQKAFLRVLNERRFRPIGGKAEVESHFRLITASNRDLDQMVKNGQFREDLLFRLKSLTIELPSLRERPEDCRDLTVHYIAKLCRQYGMDVKGHAPEFLEAIMAYDWPGNVRELVHTLERAIAVARYEPTLFPKHLPTHIRVGMACRALTGGKGREGGRPAGQAAPGDRGNRSASPGRLKDIRESALSVVERQYLIDVMEYTGWDIREACRISDLSRPRLYALMGKYRMSRPSESPSGRRDVAGPRSAPAKGHATGPR